MTEPTEANLDPTRIPDEAFELLWDRVQESWDDDKVHTAFLDYARERLLLPEAGGRYRAIKEGDPARAEVAQRQLARLMVLAFALLETAREPASERSSKWITSVAYAVAAVFLAVLIRRVIAGR